MVNLLDRIEPQEGPFRPRSVSEFFALQLAGKLDDEANVGRYARLVESQSRDLVLRAFARAEKGSRHRTIADRFEAEIQRLTPNS